MLHTLPPDLRCTDLVCPLLGTAAPTFPGPTEHSAPYDCEGQVVCQKRHDRQRLESRNPQRVCKDAGATFLQSRRRKPYTSLRNVAPQYDRPTKRISAPTRPAIQIFQRRESVSQRTPDG
ncbi:hypothetical protein EVAR_7132_1 [Eumeta japonica]|uniref:Uncharacterized protein n=1 Tax=Eumeta variegata TaxID=151549 RepID=A0A4C1U6I7_EUMVA|nr:hypothetical protein EVAR_7132_1 [Eumeta japonica]